MHTDGIIIIIVAVAAAATKICSWHNICWMTIPSYIFPLFPFVERAAAPSPALSHSRPHALSVAAATHLLCLSILNSPTPLSRSLSLSAACSICLSFILSRIIHSAVHSHSHCGKGGKFCHTEN